MDVNPLGAACEKMKVERAIKGAVEACEKLAADEARRQEAEQLVADEARRQEAAEKLRMDKLLSDVAAACDSLEKARARPVDDLIHNIFHSVMNSPM